MTIEQFSRNNQISYYEPFNDYDKLLRDPKSYVLEYLEFGDKNINMINPEDERFYHTVSIYLLGLLIYSMFRKINNLLNDHIKKNEDDTFLYSWFIGTFIHDLGYKVVVDNIYEEIFNSSSTEDVIRNVLIKLEANINRIADIVPEEIGNNLVKYNDFRSWLNDNSTCLKEYIDHGLLAGTFFIENRKSEYQRKKENGDLVLLSDGGYQDIVTGLKWSDSILNGIQYNIACIICSHNVFYQKPKSKEASQYRKMQMQELITKAPKFIIQEFPLYFLFQLVDTMDIFKKYKKYKSNLNSVDILEKIFSNIDFDFEEDCIIMSFMNFEDEFLRDYWKNLRKQEFWLPIKVKKNRNIIKIYI